jgi:hypothetical protein
LGEHRSGDDDVDRGDVAADGAFSPSACKDPLEQVADLGPERDGLLIDTDGPAV